MDNAVSPEGVGMSLTVSGTVTSGLGRGKEFVTMEGYADQFEDLLGYAPYPGTLNLALDSDIGEQLATLEPMRVDGWETNTETFGAVNCYPASLGPADNSLRVHAVVPDKTDHDTSTIELVSPVRLRDQLDLADDEDLEVTVFSPR